MSVLFVQLVVDDVVVSRYGLPTVNVSDVAAVQAVVVTHRDRPASVAVSLVPWRTIEEIAEYVAGDGTDAQRIALADGIRRKHL